MDRRGRERRPPGQLAQPPHGGGSNVGSATEALADACALEVLSALTTRAVPVPATPAAIAELIAAAPADVEQALALLERSDLVEIARRAPDGQPAFRATRDFFITDHEWAQVPPDVRRRFLVGLLEKMHDRVWAAVPRGGFDAPDVHVSWVPADLDRQAYDDVARAAAEFLERVRTAQADAVQRRADAAGDGEALRTDIMVLHFLRGGEATTAVQPEAGRERIYGLVEDLTDGVAAEDPDWAALAPEARELAALVQQLRSR